MTRSALFQASSAGDSLLTAEHTLVCAGRRSPPSGRDARRVWPCAPTFDASPRLCELLVGRQPEAFVMAERRTNPNEAAR